LDEKLHALAIDLGQGSPGRVHILQESTQAKALLDWQTLLQDLAVSDLGKMQQWLDKYIKVIPHDLIANMVVSSAQKLNLETNIWAKADAVYHASIAVAAWPNEVLRHSLRPVPALLSYIIQLRNALKIQ